MPVRQERRGVPDIHFIMYGSDGSRNLSKDMSGIGIYIIASHINFEYIIDRISGI